VLSGASSLVAAVRSRDLHLPRCFTESSTRNQREALSHFYRSVFDGPTSAAVLFKRAGHRALRLQRLSHPEPLSYAH
jgi:hypothetical protein